MRRDIFFIFNIKESLWIQVYYLNEEMCNSFEIVPVIKVSGRYQWEDVRYTRFYRQGL